MRVLLNSRDDTIEVMEIQLVSYDSVTEDSEQSLVFEDMDQNFWFVPEVSREAYMEIARDLLQTGIADLSMYPEYVEFAMED